MLRKYFSALAVLMPMMVFCSNPLSFGPPITIPGSDVETGGFTAPIISGTAAGFMVCWQDPSNDVIASLSTNLGVNWSTATAGMDSVSYPFVAGNRTGFLAVWLTTPPGFGNGDPNSSFYDITSHTWSSSLPFNSPSDAESPLFVGSSPTGFIATWTVNYDTVYANVSTDGVSWQTDSVEIGGGGYGLAGVSGCGNSEMFLVAWNDANASTIFVATSTNNGGSWNGPFTAVVRPNPDFCSVGCFANEDGFLLVYADSSSNTLWSIFSTDGTSWSVPSQIASNISSSLYAFTPSVSGTDAGFVTAWLGADNNAYASFSSDNGTQWSTPAAITTGGPVVDNAILSVSVSAYNDHCMVAWIDGSNNAVVNVSPFPTISSGPRKQSRGLFSPITPNKPGFQLNR